MGVCGREEEAPAPDAKSGEGRVRKARQPFGQTPEEKEEAGEEKEEEMNHYEIVDVVAELRRASYNADLGEGSPLSAAIDAIVPAACVDHYVALQELADQAGARAYEAQKCLNTEGVGYMSQAHGLVRLEADCRVYKKLDTLARKAKARVDHINKTGVVEE